MVWYHFRFGLIDPNQVLKRAAALSVGLALPFALSHYMINPKKRKACEDDIPTDFRDIKIAPNSKLRMRLEYDNSLRHRSDFQESTDLNQDRMGVERSLMNEKQKGDDLLVVFVGDMWSTPDMYRPLRDEILRRYADYKVHCIAIQRFGYGFDASKWFSYVKSMPNHSKLIDKAIEYSYTSDVERVQLSEALIRERERLRDQRTPQHEQQEASVSKVVPRPRGSRGSRGSRSTTEDMADASANSLDKEFGEFASTATPNTKRRILLVGHGLGAYLARGYIHGVCCGTDDEVAAVLIDPLTEFHGDSMEWKITEAEEKSKFAYVNYANLGMMEWLTSPRIPFQTHIKTNFLDHFQDFPEKIQNAIRYAACSGSFWKSGFEEMEAYNMMTQKFIPKKMTNIHEGFRYSGVIVKAENSESCGRSHWDDLDEDAYHMIITQEFSNHSKTGSSPLVKITDKNHYNVLYSLGLVDVISSKIDEFFPKDQEV